MSRNLLMKNPRRDAVDDIIDQWRRERPDLEVSPMGVIGRLGRLNAIGERRIAAGFAAHGLNLGEFDVLATLRRAGAPYRLTPTQLTRTLMLSSGAMTNRIDRLEESGLVERRDDPDDRRGILVGLTRAGRERIDAAVTDHVANEAGLLSALTKSEQLELSALLRKLLLALEADQGQ
jgi:DNA-binding MarR family transcriptional regulator